jgi:hypothetical protein
MLRRTALLTLAGPLLAACAPESKPQFKSVDITGADYGKDFTLPDTEGRMRSIKDFQGKAVVVFFGYTQCPDACPTTMAEIGNKEEPARRGRWQGRKPPPSTRARHAGTAQGLCRQLGRHGRLARQRRADGLVAKESGASARRQQGTGSSHGAHGVQLRVDTRAATAPAMLRQGAQALADLTRCCSWDEKQERIARTRASLLEAVDPARRVLARPTAGARAQACSGPCSGGQLSSGPRLRLHPEAPRRGRDHPFTASEVVQHLLAQGAARIAQIPSEVLQALNAGLVPTVNSTNSRR